jgi:acetate kinase
MSGDPPRSPGAPKGRSQTILAINGGSSSIKFGVFSAGPVPARTLSGQIERIGGKDASLVATRGTGGPAVRRPIDASDHARAAESLADWLGAQEVLGDLAGIGHRIVHGGVRLTSHQPVTPELVEELKANGPLDPAHLPGEIALIEVLGRRMPGVPQVACFDTAFHRDLPRVAQLLPIPRSYADAGIRRLGFHGLSYEYLLGELRRLAGAAAADGRVILAHLGSGASLAAVRSGRPVDTTMAFTPTAGLMMGTRPGDLDPGLLVYLLRSGGLDPEDLDDFVNERCGLLGVSGTTSDMRDLLARRAGDPRAAEAVDLFCYVARKWIGAFAAALGGLDTLVFSGGIGEHAAEVRRSICDGLEFLNLHVDGERNARHAALISTDTSAVTVRVIATDEEIMIARAVRTFLEER